MRFWKLKKKLYPDEKDSPTAKLDEQGNLITTTESLKNLYLKTYKSRLKKEIRHPQHQELFHMKEELWNLRYEKLKTVKTKDLDAKEIKRAIDSLKNNKTRDPNGMINETLKDCDEESDLVKSITILMNKIKDNKSLLLLMTLENITSVFKSKGSRLNLENDRGIFILTVFKKVLDKVLYHDLYNEVEKNMSDSNIGARKNQNVRNHLFIIYGIINAVNKEKKESIHIEIYDLVKAFDSLSWEESANDLYETIDEDKRDEKLAVLYRSNETNLVSIKTPVGLTKREDFPRIVQQGGTWGPISCSNTIDTIGKQAKKERNKGYMYKNQVKVIPLSMVDDIMSIAKCGLDSLTLNSYINTKIELKNLKFHTKDKNGKSKCHWIHVGKKNIDCRCPEVHGTKMDEVDEDVYLGDIISKTGRNKSNIENRVSKGIGAAAKIFNIIELVSFGNHSIEVGIMLCESVLISSMIYSGEVWYNLTKSDIAELENVDRMFLNKLMGIPRSTPKEAVYLELSIQRIEIILMKRRLMYLKYLL